MLTEPFKDTRPLDPPEGANRQRWSNMWIAYPETIAEDYDDADTY